MTKTFVARRISLLPYWFATPLPELLSSIGGLETITFITALSDFDRALLRDIHYAVHKTNIGIVDEQVLETAERLLNLDDSSHLKIALSNIEDAYPMLDHLQEEWATRPISIDIPLG